MKQLCIVLLIACCSIRGQAQGKLIPAGGIQIISGSKTLYQHPSLLTSQCQAFYNTYKPQIQKIVEDAIINNVHNSTGEHVRELQVQLTDEITLEADNGLEQGDFSFAMHMNGSRANFKVTTPGPLGSYADPRFDFTWDASFYMTFRDVHSPQTFICKDARMMVTGYTIKGDNTAADLIMFCNKVYSAFNKDQGFFPDMRRSSANMAGILNSKLVASIQPLLKDALLAEEFRIDGNDSLYCNIDVDNGTLLIRHPHTIKGNIYRANQKALQKEVSPPAKQKWVGKKPLVNKRSDVVKIPQHNRPAANPALKVKPALVKPNVRLNPQPLPPGDHPPIRKQNTLNPQPLPPGEKVKTAVPDNRHKAPATALPKARRVTTLKN